MAEKITKTKKRKEREVKDGMVNISDVLVHPDEDYKNWLEIAKRKLLEREVNILKERIISILQLINIGIDKFLEENTTKIKINVDHNVYNKYIFNIININNLYLNSKCSHVLKEKLSIWDGVQSNNVDDYSSFRKYFSKSKNSFDQMKLPVLATHFWIPIFNSIKQVNIYSYSSHIPHCLHFRYKINRTVTQMF